MEIHDLNRMFDQLAPTQKQEEAVLDRLLHTERKAVSMRKLNKWVVAGIAAALMLVTCAAAVAAGIIDQRLLDFMHWGGQDQELLAPGAMAMVVTAEDKGATLHVSQVLMDRYNIMLLADFTAPEGTVLDESELGYWCFNDTFKPVLELLDQEGERIDSTKQVMSYSIGALKDEDPLDNHLTLLIRMNFTGEGIRSDWEIASLFLPAKDLRASDREQVKKVITVYSGDWSCQIPITWQDMGRSIRTSQVSGQTDIPLSQVYLSPMTLQMQLEHCLKFEDINQVTLTTKDGRSVSATLDGGWAGAGQFLIYRLDEITDPAQFRSITLSNGEDKVEFSLDGPVPAE